MIYRIRATIRKDKNKKMKRRGLLGDAEQTPEGDLCGDFDLGVGAWGLGLRAMI